MKENLLLIFVKNTVLGEVKTRLAKDIGDEKALAIYKELLFHTVSISCDIDVKKIVYYSNEIIERDLFDSIIYSKAIQVKGDLGEKMNTAFNENFNAGYKHIVIIGSDCIELRRKDITEAFHLLTKQDIVIGPAKDGGYYLLGMNEPFDALFIDKPWSTADVFKRTYLEALDHGYRISLLEEKSDIDTLDDLKNSVLNEII
jgi:rSAM/selenodomain-associated transferase 1